jgi:hypothetical protein
VKKIAPWFVSALLWTSLIFYLAFVDVVVIPQTHKTGTVFPYSLPALPEEKAAPEELAEATATTVASRTAEKLVTADTDHTALETRQDGLNGAVEADGNAGSDARESKETATEANAESKSTDTFLHVFLGIPGLRFNRLNLVFGIALILVSGFISARFSAVLGGMPAMMVAFGVGSLISTKIFFWLSDTSTRIFFISTRLIESALLVIMAARMKTFYSEFLMYMGSMFGTLASFTFSLAMMTTESQLVFSTSVILPIFIILLAIPVLPLIRGSLSPKEAVFRKLELWLVAMAPFCIAVLMNWWFHIAWLGDIDIPKVSYKNTLVIYLLGLLFACALLLLRNVTVLKTKSFSWPLVLFILLLITHIALLNNVLSTHSLQHFLAHL